MSKLFATDKAAEKKTAGIFMPTECDVEGCGQDVHLLIAQVKDQRGFIRCGSFVQFGLTTKPLKVDSRYTWVGFIARCSQCLTNDMIHAGVVVGKARRDHMENYQEVVF